LELIYTIPGLGTTKELFKNISVSGHQLKVLEWPKPSKGMTLKDYAKAFLDQIDTSQPVNLMGVSFGGLLCSELCDLVKTNKVVIISSCKSRNELPSTFRVLKMLPVQKLFNDNLYLSFASKLSWAVGFEKSYLPEFLPMMRSMPTDYFKYCINMLINWDKTTYSKKIYHIHGDADTLLPHAFVKDFETIKKGTHAMIVYKAKEINTFLNKFFNGL